MIERNIIMFYDNSGLLQLGSYFYSIGHHFYQEQYRYNKVQQSKRYEKSDNSLASLTTLFRGKTQSECTQKVNYPLLHRKTVC